MNPLNRKITATISILGATLLPWTAQADSNPTQYPYHSGEIIESNQLPAGYNAAACYDSSNRLGACIHADYIYWNWQQSDFKRGELVLSSPTISGSQEGQYINPGYASGFQVGLILDMPKVDDWALSSDYTWYQNSGDLNIITDGTHSYRFIRPIFDTLYYRKGTASYNLKMHFNNLDLLLQRRFYVGKRLFTNLAAGLDAYWITEEYNVSATGFTGAGANATQTPDTLALNLNTKAWSLGPKFALQTNWLLGYGFSILANISASLVYTSYYDLSLTSTINTTTVTDSTPNNLNILRPLTSMFLGLSWDKGFGDSNYRLWLTTGWDFKLLWNYSMIDFTTTNGNETSGNLTLQGLNIRLGFAF